ncbi:hypothetical protein ABK040_009580 [Willaertia magna]
MRQPYSAPTTDKQLNKIIETRNASSSHSKKRVFPKVSDDSSLKKEITSSLPNSPRNKKSDAKEEETKTEILPKIHTTLRKSSIISDKSLSENNDRPLYLETPKTDRAIFISEDYEKVDLRFPKVTSAPLTTKSLPFSSTLSELTRFIIAEEEIDTDISSFTASRNKRVSDRWEVILNPEASVNVHNSYSASTHGSISGENEKNDVFEDIVTILGTIKTEEDKTELDEKKKQPLPHQRKKAKKIVTVKDQVDERLKILYNNQDEFDKLEKEIQLYEEKHKLNYLEKKTQYVYVYKNKKVPPNLKELRQQQLQEEFNKRDEKIAEAKERRTELLRYFLERKETLALRDQRRKEIAEQLRMELEKKASAAELYAKWGFLTCFISRFLVLSKDLLANRYIRRENEKNSRIKRLVYTKLMPVVWQKRSERWKAAWDVFKKHWIFYRLWIGVKKKKEATMIIRSFLRETNMSFQIVRQVHLFWSKVTKVQKFLKKWYNIKRARLMIQLLQYSIVEAKMIKGIPLNGEAREGQAKKKTRLLKKNPSQMMSKSNLLGSKSNLLGSFLIRQETKRSVAFSSIIMDEESMTKEKEETVKFKLSRLTLAEKTELIREDMNLREKDFLTASKIYKNRLQQYNRRVQQLMYILQAKSALSGEAVSVNPSSIKDDNGEVIEKPKPPFFKVVLSELEMKKLVLLGNTKLKEIEEEKKDKVFKEFEEDSERQTELTNIQTKRELEIIEGFEEMKRHFKDVFSKYENLLLNCEKVEPPPPPLQQKAATRSDNSSPFLLRQQNRTPTQFLLKKESKILK